MLLSSLYTYHSSYLPYCLSLVILAIPINHKNPRISIFVTLSYLHTVAITVYFLGICVLTYKHSGMYQRLMSTSYSHTHHRPVSMAQPERVPFYALWVLFEVMVPTTLLVVTVYWSAIAKHDAHRFGISSLTMHMFTFIFMMIELLINRNVYCLNHIWVLMVGGLFYTVIMAINYWATGEFVYTIFDFVTNRLNLLYIPLVVVCLILFYVIMFSIFYAKRKIFHNYDICIVDTSLDLDSMYSTLNDAPFSSTTYIS